MGDIIKISFCYHSDGEGMNTIARKGGLWIAAGTAAGIAAGVALGAASVGLALGLAAGIVAGLIARR
jgi:hypothetical protein